MQPATRSKRSRLSGQQPLAWKGIAEWVLADAGVEQTDDGETIVPYHDEGGRVVYAKCFHFARSWYEPGGIDLIPFGVERLPISPWIAERSILFIGEGESDALALREYLVGAFALGLPGAGTWKPEWKKYVKPFPRVYLVGDGDESGRRMNTRVWKDVPWARPVRLPENEDVRSILQRGGRDALLPFLREADYDALLAAALRASGDDVVKFERLVREGLES